MLHDEVCDHVSATPSDYVFQISPQKIAAVIKGGSSSYPKSNSEQTIWLPPQLWLRGHLII